MTSSEQLDNLIEKIKLGDGTATEIQPSDLSKS